MRAVPNVTSDLETVREEVININVGDDDDIEESLGVAHMVRLDYWLR